MDLLEIYIPVEAEVRRISPWSLPKSARRQMGLVLSDSEGRRKLTHSPEAIWICPVVLRRKGHRAVCHTGNAAMESLLSLLGKEIQAQPSPLQMSFVSSNRTACKVLKDTMPGKKVSAQTSLLPQGSALRDCREAVIIYNEQVYLSVTNPKQGLRQRGTPASQSSIPKSLIKRQFPQSFEPANKELQRKKLREAAHQTSTKPLATLPTKTDNHSTTDHELRNDNRPKQRYTISKVSHNVTVTQKGGDAHPQSSDPVHFHKDADGEQAAEEAAGTDTAWLHSQERQDTQIQVLSDEEEEDDYIQVNSSESDSAVVIVEQTRVGAAFVSTSLRGEVDFVDLEQEEEIARMKDKLRKTGAAVNNLSSS